MPLVNDFNVGADPEFGIVSGGHLRTATMPNDPYVPWGIDHNGYVVEPHPKPALSVKELIQNLKVSLNDFAARQHPDGAWIAGAVIGSPERTQTLGGHVHIDRPRADAGQIAGFDLFTRHLEALDVLPTKQSAERRELGNYGRFGDIRAEHGHFEYRTMPSWLFSQRVAKLCLTGTKLIAADPTAPQEVLGSVTTASKTKLKNLFERFRHKDDDADWLLSGGLFTRKLAVRPDRDIRDVWQVEPKTEDPHWKRARNLPDPAGVQLERPLEEYYPSTIQRTLGGQLYFTNLQTPRTGAMIGNVWPPTVAFTSMRVSSGGVMRTWHVALPPGEETLQTNLEFVIRFGIRRLVAAHGLTVLGGFPHAIFDRILVQVV